MAGRVFVMGYLSRDRVTQPDGTARDQAGGAALYAALGARACGAEVVLLAAYGEDWPAAWLDEAARCGLDVARCERRAGPTRRARIAHAADGARHSPHHDDPLWWERTAALAPPLPPPLAREDVLMLAPMPARHMQAALDAAGGGRALADTSEAFVAREAEALRAVLPRLCVFAPSHDELASLAPLPTSCVLVEKRGAEGLLLHEPREAFAPPAVQVRDPTGAGDATVGAIAAGLALGRSLREAVREAVLVGARCVTGHGASALGFAA